MPRVAQARSSAEPASPDQHARQMRILRAAARLGAQTDLEHVQMQEVARQAGVATGTLYRYFPSKTHLFVGVMAYQIERLGAVVARQPAAPGGPPERVFDLLARANRMLTGEPELANAMVKSAGSANPVTVTDVARIESMMRRLMLAAAGIRRPTAKDMAIVRVLVQAWRGTLQSSVNGPMSRRDAEKDLRLACQLMVAGSTAVGS